MAKTKRASEKSAPATETKERVHPRALQANKELAATLGGYEQYYHAKTKRELDEEFVTGAMNELKKFKADPRAAHLISECQDLEKEFDDLKDTDRNFTKALNLAGKIVSNLHSCLLLDA